MCRWNVNQKSQDTRKHWQSSLPLAFDSLDARFQFRLQHFSHSNAHRLHKRPKIRFFFHKNLIEFFCSNGALFKYDFNRKTSTERTKNRIYRKENIGLQMFSFILLFNKSKIYLQFPIVFIVWPFNMTFPQLDQCLLFNINIFVCVNWF